MTGSTTGTLVYPSSGNYGINETKCWRIEVPKPYIGIGIYFHRYSCLLSVGVSSFLTWIPYYLSRCYSFLLLHWNCGLFLVCFQMRENRTEVFFHFPWPFSLFFHLSSAFARLCTYPLYGAQTIKVTKKKRSNRLLCFTKTTDDKKNTTVKLVWYQRLDKCFMKVIGCNEKCDSF